MKSYADIYAVGRKPSNHLTVQPLWWYNVQNMEHKAQFLKTLMWTK